MAARTDIETFLNALLTPERFNDYGPNGLQAEGRGEMRKIVSGVTASRAFIEAGIAAGADALFVHHGLVTGEISEPLAHIARATGVAFPACGHHATERYGAPAVAAHLAETFGIAHEFIKIGDPA